MMIINLSICIKMKAIHNAICLVTSWKRIRLGFMITPSQIVHPNSVQMLMLVVHLFETLPSYLPRSKVCYLNIKIIFHRR